MTTHDIKEKAAGAAEKVRDTAASARETAADAGRKFKAEAVAFAEDARETASEKAGEARDSFVATGDRLAQALADQAEASEGVPSHILSGLADGVTTVTSGLRGRSFGDLYAGVQGYAKRNPGKFALGAAVAGFALARFLRASDTPETADPAPVATPRPRASTRRSVADHTEAKA